MPRGRSAYGIPGLRVDGNDALAVHAATAWAAGAGAEQSRATLIELFTYRAEGHSTSDDPSHYRPADEATRWPLGDPIARLRDHLVVLGAWDEERHAALVKEVAEEVRAAQKQAETHGTLGREFQHGIESLFDDVFEETPWHLREQCALAMAELAEKTARGRKP